MAEAGLEDRIFDALNKYDGHITHGSFAEAMKEIRTELELHGSFRCARCPKQIKPEDPREKIGRFTYCEECAEEKKNERTENKKT